MQKEGHEMSRFGQLLAIMCACAMSGAAWAAGAAEDATRFFETHPNAIDLKEEGESLLFANRRVGLEFQRSAGDFQLTRLYGIAERHDFLTEAMSEAPRDLFEIRMILDPKRVAKDERWNTKTSLMGIVEEMAKDAFSVGPHAAKSVSYRREGTDSESVLHLQWKEMDVREDKGVVDVEATVTLRAGDPLSYWRIAVRNRGTRYGIERVRFPILNLAPIGKAEDNVLIYPQSRGRLVENPFTQRKIQGYYTCEFEMQFQALYNQRSGSGIYLATQEATPCLTHLQIACTPSEIAWRPGHFPPNISFSEEDFTVPYDTVAGPFHGDWYDACQIYREWALKQTWCAKGPLSTRKDVPKWYKEAPLYFYTHLTDTALGTYSLDENLPIAAAHFREFLKWAGVPLPLQMYGWTEYHPELTTFNCPFDVHRMPGKELRPRRWAGMPTNCAHVGVYPKIPALRGFSAECKRLKAEGGMVLPYLPCEMFDQGPSENSPYAAEAKPNVIRDLYGALRTWGGITTWQMCSATPWWRVRMKETGVLMVERENVGGLYLDTMRGSCLPCYWTPHGHSAAGGSSMTVARHDYVKVIHEAVKAKDPEAIITGENPSENMIDVIDGMLIYTLWPDTKAPLLATVYQDYIKRYGLEISVGAGDAFFIECASLFTEGTQIGMLRLRPRTGGLSFQNPEHKEMLDFLGRVVGYYKQEATKKFLAYGQLLRPLEFREPDPMPMLAHKPRHGTTGQESDSGAQFPALMSGVFRSPDGELGVFVVNASNQALEFQAELDPARYGMPAGTVVDVDTFAPDGASKNVLSKAKGKVTLKGTLPGHGISMFRLKPTAR